MNDEWSKRRAHIPSTSALPAHTAPMAIASALQGSIAATNVARFILLVLKTIFHHHAKFCRKQDPKMSRPLLPICQDNSKISVTMLYSLESSFKYIYLLIHVLAVYSIWSWKYKVSNIG